MWDALITLGNLAVIPALIPTVISKQAYVPRITSGLSVIGIMIVIVGLIGEGLVASPIVLAGIGVMWVAIFFVRGTETVPGHSHVAIGAHTSEETAPEPVD